MIKKERPDSLRIKLEEALLRRLPKNHEKRSKIIENLRKNRAGRRGELELDYQLSFLPENPFLIFNDLRLPSASKKDRYFQIDTLLLCEQMAIIIESKNIYGHLFFDAYTEQVIRTFDGQKEGFANPLTQAQRQKVELEKWFAQFMNKNVPIFYFVSIGRPSTILETQQNNYHIFKQVFHAEHLPSKILNLIQQCPDPLLSSYQLKRISDQLLKEDKPPEINIFTLYDIDPIQLIRGIPCSSCSSTQPLKRTHSKWICPTCKTKSKIAHIQPIEDHLLLHGTITNPVCRELLALQSEHAPTVKRLLASMKLPYKGDKKNRVYYIPK